MAKVKLSLEEVREEMTERAEAFMETRKTHEEEMKELFLSNVDLDELREKVGNDELFDEHMEIGSVSSYRELIRRATAKRKVARRTPEEILADKKALLAKLKAELEGED